LVGSDHAWLQLVLERTALGELGGHWALPSLTVLLLCAGTVLHLGRDLLVLWVIHHFSTGLVFVKR